MKCICELIKEGHSEKLSVGDWNDIYMRKEYGKYYIEAIADGNTYLRLNYCPKCGRKLEEDDYMNKNTMIANIVTIGGIGLCLAIAALPVWFSVLVMVSTVVGCHYLSKKDK